MKKIKILNANKLQLIAMIAMLLDHIYTTIMPNQIWMNYIGRIAFPIFCFQIAEGYNKTHNLSKYKKRLLLSAILSEIPYNLMCYEKIFYPTAQNVLWGLLAGIFFLEILEKLINTLKVKYLMQCILILIVCTLLMFDYYLTAPILISVFYLFRNIKYKEIIYFISMLILFIMWGNDIQIFGVLSIIPIILYNGKNGKKSKINYLFYPIHQLILGIIKIVIN